VTLPPLRALRGAALALSAGLLAVFAGASPALANRAADGWDARHQPRFEPLSSSTAIVDGPVRAVVDDLDGLVWLVGGSELWRWDGGQLVRVGTEDDALSRDDAPPVMAVARDASGRLWAGGSPGLFLVDRGVPGRPRLLPVPVEGEPKAVSMFAFRRGEAAAGAGWSGLAGRVDDVLVLDDERVVARLPIPGGGPNRVHALHVDAGGRAWVGTSFGLYELRREGAADWRWREQPLAAPQQRVAAITSDADGRLWVGTALDGLLEIRGDAAVRHPWPADGPPARIFALAAVDAKAIWVGTFGSGVWAYSPGERRWRVMRHSRGRSDSLQDDNVWALHRDRRGLMWVGHGAGAQFLDPLQERFLHIPLEPEPGDPGVRLRVHALAPADAEGRSLWLGLGNGRIRRIGDGPADAALDRRWVIGDGVVGAVELLQPLPDGRWLLGSDWMTRLAPADGGPLRELEPAARLPARYSSAVVAWQGAWWQAGPDGLWRLPLSASGDPKLAEARNLYADATGERRIASLLARPERLWIGTWSGLSRLRGDAEAPQRIDVPGLAGLFVSSMAVDGTGRLWLATTEGGLFHAPEASADTPSAWRRLGTADGLPTRGVAGLLVDAGGRPWVSTARGLAMIDPADFRISLFDSHDGASAAPYMRRSAALLPDGTLAFGGNDAITLVRPGDDSPPRPSPEVALVLTGLRAGEGEAPPRLLAPPGELPRWRFEPDTARIEIDIVAPLLLHPERLRHRHRLFGIDADWVEGESGQRTSSYSRIPAGDYRFEAEYSLDGGPWQGRLAIGISRAPSWHEQPLVRASALVLVAMALVLGWRARSRVLRARAAALERMVDARTAALAAANVELEQAHRAVEAASLTDPLTGLHNRRFLWRHIEADVALALRSRHGEAGGGSREPVDLVFFLVDIDHFKRINDQHGHAVGDLVLIEMGRRLRAVFRESDHVVRWGGEEFLGVARGTPREEAPRVAERILEAISATPFELPGGRTLAVRCSIGFAALPLVPAHRHAFGWEDTVAVADEALYEAKSAGRDGWAGFEESGAPVEGHHLAALRLRTASAIDIPGLRLRRSRA
jgi:diguanylate cyclase (GGDEF)-like protein